jgi:MFS family permease
MAAEDYPPRPYAWTVVAILIATAVLSFTDRQVLSLLVDPIRNDLQITDAQIGLLLGIAFALVYGAAGIPLGYLADRVSRRNLIFAGVVVWSVGTVACGLSNNFGEIFASRIVVGLGEGALAPSAISLISDYFPPQRRGTAVALFLSGIAMGSGVAILIGGAVLHFIEANVGSGNWWGLYAPWRMVLLLIGGPGLVWALVIFVIREPLRHTADADADADADEARAQGGAARESRVKLKVVDLLKRVAPVYVTLAAASFVDNAVGGWAPSLLIRGFARDPAQIGLQLGAWLTIGFGGGVLIGGALADRAALRGGWSSKLKTCLLVSALILPVSLLINSSGFAWAMAGVPLYFLLSGIVTAVGFSAVLDVVPNQSRGLAMSIAFFLNVALGAGLGPEAVALAGEHVFGAGAGLGPPIVATVMFGYALSLLAMGLALAQTRQLRAVAA